MKRWGTALAGLLCALVTLAPIRTTSLGEGGANTQTVEPGTTIQSVLAALSPSVTSTSHPGNVSAYVKEMDDDALGQRFRTPDNGPVTVTMARLKLRRTGAFVGDLTFYVEDVDTGETRDSTSPPCTSETVDVQNVPTGSMGGYVDFFIDGGCTLDANTEYHAVLDGDAAGYDANDSGSQSVAWYVTDESAPCTSGWVMTDSSPDGSGTCDRGEDAGGAGTWVVTAGVDFVFAIGTPHRIRLNAGVWADESIQIRNQAFLEIQGSGKQATILKQDESVTDESAFEIRRAFGLGIRDLSVVSEIPTTADLTGLDTNAFVYSTEVNDLWIENSRWKGAESWLRLNSVDGLHLTNNDVSVSCLGMEVVLAEESKAWSKNNYIQISQMEEGCGAQNTENAAFHWQAFSAPGQNEIYQDNDNIRIHAEASGFQVFGIIVNNSYDGTYYGSGIRIIVDANANSAMAGFSQSGTTTVELVNPTIIMTNPGTTNTNLIGYCCGCAATEVATCNVRGGHIEISGGGGSGSECALCNNHAGSTLTARGVSNDTSNIISAGTMDVSPTFGSAVVGAASPTAVTANGATTTHSCSCSSDAAACVIDNVVATAADTVSAIWTGCTDSVDTVSCACVKLP